MIVGVIYIIVFAVVLIILFQNYEVLSQSFHIKVNLIFAEYKTKDMPLGVWMIIVFTIGFIVAYLRFLPYRVRYLMLRRKTTKEEVAEEKKKMEEREEEKEMKGEENR